MKAGIRTAMLCCVAAALVWLPPLGETGAVSATPDQYDPRHDPNYTPASRTHSLDWQAVWALVWEFEARSHPNVGRSQPSSHFAMPQPWHYVQEFPSPGATRPISGAAAYGAPFGVTLYGYESWFPGWWISSPRIPWWSLIPPSTHPRHRHHGGQGHHHW